MAPISEYHDDRRVPSSGSTSTSAYEGGRLQASSASRSTESRSNESSSPETASFPEQRHAQRVTVERYEEPPSRTRRRMRRMARRGYEDRKIPLVDDQNLPEELDFGSRLAVLAEQAKHRGIHVLNVNELIYLNSDLGIQVHHHRAERTVKAYLPDWERPERGDSLNDSTSSSASLNHSASSTQPPTRKGTVSTMATISSMGSADDFISSTDQRHQTRPRTNSMLSIPEDAQVSHAQRLQQQAPVRRKSSVQHHSIKFPENQIQPPVQHESNVYDRGYFGDSYVPDAVDAFRIPDYRPGNY